MNDAIPTHTVRGSILHYVSQGEAPELLRRIADDLEASDACLIGLWSVGFGAPNELVLQVVVDDNPQGGTTEQEQQQ